MNTKPQIIWQKWQDNLLEHPTSIEDEDAEDDNYLDQTEHHENEHPRKHKQTVFITPMGILPYNEATACNKVFNLWVGHTNFTITNNISNIIENAIGVETLDIFTRYRFRIGVGQAFSDSDVMRNINKVIYDYIYESKQ